MQYVINIDRIFLLNFVMNVYVYKHVNLKYGKCTSKGRIVLGALTGTISYIGALMLPGLPVIKMIAGSCISYVGLLLIAFRVKGIRNILKFLKDVFISYVTVAGLILFFLQISILFPKVSGNFYIRLLLSLAFVSMIDLVRERKETVCPVELKNQDHAVKTFALIDSGNSLLEPISRKPVSVVRKGIFEQLRFDEQNGFRAVPYSSVGCEKGILYAYELPEMVLMYNGMEKKILGIYIAEWPDLEPMGEHKKEDRIGIILNPEVI